MDGRGRRETGDFYGPGFGLAEDFGRAFFGFFRRLNCRPDFNRDAQKRTPKPDSFRPASGRRVARCSVLRRAADKLVPRITRILMRHFELSPSVILIRS